jgi:membrane fusion protein (multidrug efflux system)
LLLSQAVKAWTLFALIATATVLTGACKEPPPAAAPASPEVYATSVIQKDVPVYLDLVGQTEGSEDVEIRARVEGFLETMNFQEGSFVRKGDLLYTIDPKPLQAVLEAARAERATAMAALGKANNDVARYAPLVAKQAVSRQELDNAQSAQEAARAQVEAAAAAIDKATLDLGYTRVTAPISGLVGTTNVKPGNLVGRGESTLLTTISQIDPILFRVGLTEAEYLRLVKLHPERVGKTPAVSGIELALADGTVYPSTGSVRSIERAVNPTTGTIGVELTFPNPQSTLRPGQYGRARVLLDTKAGALLVPQRAVQELQGLYSVAVIDPDQKIAFRNVKVGPRVEGNWVIEEGLEPGEQVVVEGLQAVRDGISVRAKPWVPPADAEPVATGGKAQ